MKKQLTQSRGFTLIELLVVIAIIGILASVVLSSLDGARAAARDTKRISDMRAIAQSLEMFRNANGRYPGVPDGIPTTGQMIGVGNEIDDALSPFLPIIPIDPRHDAGTGVTPITGSLYFYSYDPQHMLDNCDGSPTINGITFGFNYAESLSTPDRQTCAGADMNLDQAFFNRVSTPESI